MAHANSLTLPLKYPVYCRTNAFDDFDQIVAHAASAHRYAVISDDTVAELYAERVVSRLPFGTARLFTIPPGENQKTRERWAELTDALFAWGAGRDTTVIALGGGVVGDLAGFVAATFMRGVPVIQVPTTLLAMVDASVGGKTAIDTPFGKNLVGAFHEPNAVVIDPAFLNSLPAAQWSSGLAEMIKHGVIADARYFGEMVNALPQILDRGSATEGFDELVARSVQIKADVVAQDMREGGLRQILNFGHTIAHAVERELNYTIAHGEAVAMGMVAETRIAESIGVCARGLHQLISNAVQAAGLPPRWPDSVAIDAIIASTQSDKKTRTGTVRYALPRGIGEMERGDGSWSVPISDDVVREALVS